MVNESTPRFRLETGLDVLEHWADTAGHTDKNAVYTALFAMQDRSLFRYYRVIEDFQRPDEVFVIVTQELVMKIRVSGLESFGIVAIGPRSQATDLRTGRWHAA
jgi:hypothetical protein